MKVLWMTREDPRDPDRGDLLYSYGLISALVGAGAQVTVLSFSKHGSDEHGISNGNPSSIVIRRPRIPRGVSLLTRLPADAFRNCSRAYRRALLDALDGDVDVAVIDYFAMGWISGVLSDAVKRSRSRGRGLCIVYVSHHFEQQVRMQVANEYRGGRLTSAILPWDARKSCALERKALGVADLVTTITESDRQSFLGLHPDLRVVTLTPGYSGTVSPERKIDLDRPKRVLLIGAFDWIAKRQNLEDFVTAARVKFEQAGISMQVVGRVAPDFAKHIARVAPFCTFTGPVADVYPYASDARIGLMPDVIGGGFKLKYLDYIFNGLPVATIRSQAIGLPLNLDDDLVCGDSCEDLTSAIVRVIDDIERLDRMRKSSFEKCASAFRWQDRGERLIKEIEYALSNLSPEQ